MERRVARSVLACLVAVGLGACASPLTEIVVVVDSDLPVTAELDGVRLDVVGSTPETRSATATLTGPASLPVTLGLRPASSSSRDVAVTATGLHGGNPVVSTVVRTSFIEGRRLVLHMYLLRACETVHCPSTQTCRAGACVDPAVMPETLPPFGGSLDGGSDLGAPLDSGGRDGGVDMALPATCMHDTDCNDHDVCNGGEVCAAGACVHGSPLGCDDGVACTRDTCDPVGGCGHTADDTLCTAVAGGHCDMVDGCQYAVCDATTCADDPATCAVARCMGTTCIRQSRCGTGQTCCAGTCVAPACDDGNACTDDTCGATGCVHADNHAACSDGNPCSTGDTCSAGSCQPGGATSCTSTGNPCTVAMCSPSAGGCTNVPVSGTCDDGNACTTGDACAGGTCVGGAAPSCDDGVACTADSCGAGGCVHAPSDALCTAVAGGHCDAAMGCQYPACNTTSCAPDPSMCQTATCSGSMCVRGSTCTGAQTCCAGACVAAGCDDGNPCTSDACSPSGCIHAPNDAAPCSDGSACSTGDHCSGGTCVSTGSVSCDDGNACTDDVCSAGTGICQHTNNSAACSDGNACTTGDACSLGVCRSGGATVCDDLDACTTDGCSPSTGCTHTHLSCSCCDVDVGCQPRCNCVPPLCL